MTNRNPRNRPRSRRVRPPGQARSRAALLAAMVLGIGLAMPACEDAAPPTAPAPAPAPPPPPEPEPPPAPEPPGVPAGLAVSATGPGFVEWSWTPLEGAEGYQVQYSPDAFFTADDELVDRTGEETSYRRENVPAGTSAHLRVRASTGAGEERVFGDWSASVSGMSPIPVPLGLTVSATGGDFIEWSWEAVEGAAGYQVQYSPDATFTAEDEIVDRTAGQLSWRKEDLPYRMPGHARVRTLLQVGFQRLPGDWSADVPGMSDPPPPGFEWALVREGGGLVSPRGTKGARLVAVASNDDGRFVAVGWDGTIAWSDDNGVTWTEASQTATGARLMDVAWGGGRFVAVGYDSDRLGILVHSDDGDRWELASQQVADRPLYGVTWGAGRFVAVGAGGNFVSSDDGDRWELKRGNTTQYLFDVAWGGGRFVAVGSHGRIRSTDDGRRINKVPDRPTSQWLYGVAWGAGRFVAVGANSRVFHSADGDRWERASSSRPTGPTATTLHAIAWDGGRFTVVGNDGAIASSADGDRWTEERSGTSRNHLYGVASNGEGFVTVGGSFAGLGTILRGQGGTWRRADISESLPFLTAASSHDGRIVAVGVLGAILHSDDSKLWEEARSNPRHPYLAGIAHNGDRFVAVGNGPAAFFHSEDGDTWREASVIPDRSDPSDVIWTGTRFLASSRRSMVHSVDGDRWEEVEIPSETLVRGVAAMGSRLVAIDGAGSAFYSDDDGESWTATSATGVEGTFMRAVASDGRRVVAVGANGTIIHSNDGNRWRSARETATEELLRRVAWSGERFVAVGGYGAVVHSEDGDRWEAAPAPATPENLVGVHWTGAQFIAVGYNGTIVVSPKPEQE